MLSYTQPLVTTAEADAYFAASGNAEWGNAELAAKEAALVRGQRFVATVYNSRWSTEFDQDTAPVAVRLAIVEAALRELTAPGSLAPVMAAGPQKVLTGLKGITWQVVNDGSGRRVALIPAVEALLADHVTPATGSTAVTSMLRY